MGLVIFIINIFIIYQLSNQLNKFINNIFFSSVISIVLAIAFMPLAVILLFCLYFIGGKKTTYENLDDIQNSEAGILIALMAKVAKADGRVSELEAELIKNTLTDVSMKFKNQAKARETLKQIYSHEKENLHNASLIASKYLLKTKYNYQKRLFLVKYLLHLAFIDGSYTQNEAQIIQTIATSLKISPSDFSTLLADFKHSNSQKSSAKKISLIEAYEILGANRQDSFSEIKKKYRSLVRKYHPDILTGQGKDKHTIEQATKKLQQINEAYELIEKHLR